MRGMEGAARLIIRSACSGKTLQIFLCLFLIRPAFTFSVFSTIYTGDARFVLSGSDDGNLRLWKAHASEKLGIIGGRERAAREYRTKLREKWKYDPEVGKIERYVEVRPRCKPCLDSACSF
jgi:Sof1-like domain